MNGNPKLHLLDKMLVSGVNSNIAHQTSKEKNIGNDTNVFISAELSTNIRCTCATMTNLFFNVGMWGFHFISS